MWMKYCTPYNIRSEVLTALNINKSIPGYRPGHLVKSDTRFKDYICLHHEHPASHHMLMAGRGMVPETLAMFNQLTRMIV
jgi:hypothetical protein